jgi:hypothetical protein
MKTALENSNSFIKINNVFLKTNNLTLNQEEASYTVEIEDYVGNLRTISNVVLNNDDKIIISIPISLLLKSTKINETIFNAFVIRELFDTAVRLKSDEVVTTFFKHKPERQDLILDIKTYT